MPKRTSLSSQCWWHPGICWLSRGESFYRDMHGQGRNHWSCEQASHGAAAEHAGTDRPRARAPASISLLPFGAQTPAGDGFGSREPQEPELTQPGTPGWHSVPLEQQSVVTAGCSLNPNSAGEKPALLLAPPQPPWLTTAVGSVEKGGYGPWHIPSPPLPLLQWGPIPTADLKVSKSHHSAQAGRSAKHCVFSDLQRGGKMPFH